MINEERELTLSEIDELLAGANPGAEPAPAPYGDVDHLLDVVFEVER